MKNLFMATAIIVTSMAVMAQDSPWRTVTGISYADGGQRIASGTITTIGTNRVTPFDIQSGVGFQERIGVEYRWTDRISVQCSIGHSASEAMGMDGSLDFTTIPLELMGFVELGKGFRIGAGLRQSHAEMRGTGKAENFPLNGSYSGNQGSVFELQYLFKNGVTQSGASPAQFGLSLRNVSETFTHRLGAINGDHIELGVVLYY
ncbi:MAG: hypothetical protein WCK07_24685 [Betaproteobacteria bacterium]